MHCLRDVEGAEDSKAQSHPSDVGGQSGEGRQLHFRGPLLQLLVTDFVCFAIIVMLIACKSMWL